MVNEERLVSEFNEAAFQISRLHNLWLETKNLREKGRLIKCKWKLDSAAIELWNDALRLDEDIDKEEEKYTYKLQELDKSLDNAGKKSDLASFYDKLVEKEKLLREIQEKAGKGAKLRPADDDLM